MPAWLLTCPERPADPPRALALREMCQLLVQPPVIHRSQSELQFAGGENRPSALRLTTGYTLPGQLGTGAECPPPNQDTRRSNLARLVADCRTASAPETADGVVWVCGRLWVPSKSIVLLLLISLPLFRLLLVIRVIERRRGRR